MIFEKDPVLDSKAAHPEATGPNDERPGVVLLVRCWLEPQRDGEPVVRGYIRDVTSGRRVAISELEAVEEHLRRQLYRAPRQLQGERERSA